MASVSIIIPCYRYGHYLRACVESALSQENVEVRVLVIDDASPDDTAEVGAALVEEDSRVEFRRHTHNLGHIATYNEGLAWASGDYTLVLSADDMLTPGALSRAVALMDAHAEVGMTYGRAIHTSDPSFSDWQPPRDYAWRIRQGRELIEAMCADGENHVPTPTAIVRTRLQKELGGYRPDLPHAGDMEMWLRFAVHAAIGVLDVEQAYYRVHGQNMSFRYTGLRDLREKQGVFDVLFEQYGGRIADAPCLRQKAARAIAEAAFWRASHLFDAGELAACQECISYALSLHPKLRRETKWWRFRFKQAIGPRLWSAVRPVLRNHRGRPVPLPVRAE